MLHRVLLVFGVLLLLLNLLSPVLETVQPAWPGRVVPAGAAQGASSWPVSASPTGQVRSAGSPPLQPRAELPAFREGLLASPVSLNPLLPGGDNPVTDLLFRGLTRLTPEGVVVPDLAEGWQQRGGTDWTVRLKPGLHWHDGAPVRAADILFTLQAAAHPFFQGDPSTRLRALLWASRRVEVLDEQTVRITLDQADGSVPFDLTLPLLPAHLLGPDPAGWASAAFAVAPVGTGPFRWGSSDSETISLDAFHQADGEPRFRGYQFRILASEAEAWQALAEGKIDGITYAVPPSLLPSSQPPVPGTANLHSWPTADTLLLLWSPSADPALVRVLSPGLAAATSLWPPYPAAGQPAAAPQAAGPPAAEPQAADPAVSAAAEALNRLGWLVGDDGFRTREGQRLTAQIAYGNGLSGPSLEARRLEAAALAKRLMELGVDVQLHAQGDAQSPDGAPPLSGPGGSAPLSGRLVLWRGGRDPDLTNLIRALPAPAPELLHLARQARQSPDAGRQRAQWSALARRLAEDGLVAPLARGTGFFAFRGQLGGPGPNDPFDRLAWVWRSPRPQARR